MTDVMTMTGDSVSPELELFVFPLESDEMQQESNNSTSTYFKRRILKISLDRMFHIRGT